MAIGSELEPPPRGEREWKTIWRDWLFNLYKYVKDNMNKDFFFEVSRGNIEGHSNDHVLAYSAANTNATENDLWPTASSKKTWRTSAATLEAISTSANDTSGGTGAQSLLVYGLDANWEPITDTITMNGISASTATTKSFIRVNYVVVTSVGAYASGATTGANVGQITVRVSGGGATECDILAGEGNSENSHYSVPAGKTAYLSRVMLNVDASKTSGFKLYTRTSGDDVTGPSYGPRVLTHEWPGVSGLFQERTVHYFEVPEKTDIWFTAVPGASDTAIHIDYDIILVDN